jgi:hypothetical protein
MATIFDLLETATVVTSTAPVVAINATDPPDEIMLDGLPVTTTGPEMTGFLAALEPTGNINIQHLIPIEVQAELQAQNPVRYWIGNDGVTFRTSTADLSGEATEVDHDTFRFAVNRYNDTLLTSYHQKIAVQTAAEHDAFEQRIQDAVERAIQERITRGQ